MRILLTNDDGILAPGIEALHHAATRLGDVTVVAPTDAQSASSHAISVLKPLEVQHVHVNQRFWGWSVGGRPADCVKLAMLELLDERPDLVLSGINAGANVGVNVLYSGTIAGAVEGALFGVPSIAVSLELSDELDFDAAGQVAHDMIAACLAAGLAAGACLSMNIPALDQGPPRGVQCCPQAPVNWKEHYRKKTERGRTIYWLDGRVPEHHDHPDTDLAAVADGYVAVTPLRPNLTAPEQLDVIRAWSWPASLGGEGGSAAARKPH